MKLFFKKLFRIIVITILISIASVFLFRWIPIPITPLMIIRCVEQKMDGKKIKLYKDWESLDKISPHLQLAVVCSEDQNFINHNGFDFKAIEKAMDYNENHKKKRGASTISQQTAKNVFLWPGRSWIRKGLEVYFTFLIEALWSKERIMEAYLNVIEMGDGVYGAQATADLYFNKNASQLSKSQAALIAAVLPNPKRFSIAHPSAYTRSRQSWIVRQMGYWGNKLDYEKSKQAEDN